MAASYITLRISGSAELGLKAYATVTVIYYVIWLLCSLWVARFDLLIGGEFVVTSAAMAAFMIGGDHLFQWMGAAPPIRSIGDVLLAMPVVAAGLWIAMKRMSGRDPLDRSQSGCTNR